MYIFRCTYYFPTCLDLCSSPIYKCHLNIKLSYATLCFRIYKDVEMRGCCVYCHTLTKFNDVIETVQENYRRFQNSHPNVEEAVEFHITLYFIFRQWEFYSKRYKVEITKTTIFIRKLVYTPILIISFKPNHLGLLVFWLSILLSNSDKSCYCKHEKINNYLCHLKEKNNCNDDFFLRMK